jgi:hypothetical protein
MLGNSVDCALDEFVYQKFGVRNILPSVNSLIYVLMAFQQYKLFVPVKIEKVFLVEELGKFKTLFQTFKFAF